MPRQYRRSLRGFIVCAVAGLVLAGVAGADNQTSFVDPAGDAGSSVDITGLRVSSHWSGGGSNGGVGLEVTVTPNRFWCGGDGDGDLPLLIAIDTRPEPRHRQRLLRHRGRAFVLAAGQCPRGEPVFRRATGWGFKAAPYPRWRHRLGVRPDRSAGISSIPRHSGSRRPAASTSSPSPSARTPTPLRTSAPSTTSRSPGRPRRSSGPTGARRTSSPLPPRPFTATLVTLTYRALDGRGKTADTIRIYRGKRLLKTIRRPLRDSNPFELSHVSWRVPRSPSRPPAVLGSLCRRRREREQPQLGPAQHSLSHSA